MANSTNTMAKIMLASFKTSLILSRRKLYVDDTTGFDIGMDISISETLTRLERIKRFFRLTTAPVYVIVAKDANSLTIAPSSGNACTVIKKWSSLPRAFSDTITFKRPSIYVSDC